MRLRLHWATEEAPGIGAAEGTLAMELTLAGVRLSLVEASVTRLPREARSPSTIHACMASENSRQIPMLCACMNACGFLHLE